MLPNQMPGGAPECPCIVEPVFRQELCIGAMISIGLSNDVCIPKNFGSNCSMHHLDIFSECENYNKKKIPDWCYQKWCFVNATKCFPSKYTFVENVFDFNDNSMERSIAISSSTCGGSDSIVDFLPTVSLKDRVIDAIIPYIHYPFYYLERDDGTQVPPESEEYFMNNGTWRGVLIDYFEIVKINSDIGNFKFKPRAGNGVSSVSPYVESIRDVNNGLADMAAGLFFVASDEYEMATWSTSIGHPLFAFYTLTNDNGGEGIKFFLFDFEKTFAPFEKWLWLSILIILIVVALLNVYFATERGDHGHWHNALHNAKWKQSLRNRRAVLRSQVYLDSFLSSVGQYFGNAAEIDHNSSISHKLLSFGFGFFILVVGSSYTANLASFLSMKQPNYRTFESFEMMIEKKIKICVPGYLQETVSSIHNDNWVYINSAKYHKKAYKALKDRKCDVMYAEEHILRADLGCQDDLHRLSADLMVNILNFPMMLPVNSDLSAALSSAIANAMQAEGVDFDSIYRSYIGGDCYGSSDALTNSELTVLDLIFPLNLLFLCMFLAVCTKSLKLKFDLPRDDRITLFSSYFKNLSPQNTGKLRTQETIGDEEFNEYLDLIEYKYRLELVTYDISKVERLMCRRLQKFNDPFSKNS